MEDSIRLVPDAEVVGPVWSAIAQAKFARLSGLVYARGLKHGREHTLIQGDLSK